MKKNAGQFLTDFSRKSEEEASTRPCFGDLQTIAKQHSSHVVFDNKGKYNLIASVYSKENHKVVEKIVSASVLNNIHYYDSTKIKSWLSEAGQLQLLPTITTNSMFSEIDFPNDANIQKICFHQKKMKKALEKSLKNRKDNSRP